MQPESWFAIQKSDKVSIVLFIFLEILLVELQNIIDSHYYVEFSVVFLTKSK